MDRIINSKVEKQSIYEIYRACRLCGAGAGYKMPIIQNVVDLDGNGVELKHKIQECLQIEVNQDDKMPPLICELCVDKVNDFYEFVDLCKQTNKRTRLRLGLPLQTVTKGSSVDSGDCILGVTEPVYVQDDDDEPLTQVKSRPKVKVKKEVEVRIKKEPELVVMLENKIRESRSSISSSSSKNSSKLRQASPSPPRRVTRRGPSPSSSPPRARNTRSGHCDDNVTLSSLKQQTKIRKSSPESKSTSKTTQKSSPSAKSTPKSILKKEVKSEEDEDSSPILRGKRPRDKEPAKEVPQKKVKITVQTKPSPSKRRAPTPPPIYACLVCDLELKSVQGLSGHMKTHPITFTKPELACNACGLWFETEADASAHHKQHRDKRKPYRCRRCRNTYKSDESYDEHITNNSCGDEEVPDVKCSSCWHLFPTKNWLKKHKCPGKEGRPGGKCMKCRRSYALLKNLKKHESSCVAKNKPQFKIDPEIREILKPVRVITARCDALLVDDKQGHYDVSSVPSYYGFDEDKYYPYRYFRSWMRTNFDISFDTMVSINDDIRNEFCNDFVHWDSDESESEDEGKRQIESLTAIALKTIFSQKLVGRVPRRKRKIKEEKCTEFSKTEKSYEETDFSKDISSIIDNLNDSNDSFQSDSLINRVDDNNTEKMFNNLINKCKYSGENNDSKRCDENNDSNRNDNDEGKIERNDGKLNASSDSGDTSQNDDNNDSKRNDNDHEGNDGKQFGDCDGDDQCTSQNNDDTKINIENDKVNNFNKNCDGKDALKDTKNSVNVTTTSLSFDYETENSEQVNSRSVNYKVNGANCVNDTLDDQKLMDALDEQIGDGKNEGKDSETCDGNLKGMDLDKVSDDEYNFD